MNTLNWKCIFKYNQQIYFVRNTLTGGCISDGINTVKEFIRDNVTGCTYNGEMIWLSTVGSNELVCVDLQENENYMPVLAYDTVRIVNMVTGQKKIIVLEGVREEKSEIFLFDGINGCILCVLPIHEKYLDFVIEGEGKGFLLCEEPIAVPGCYSDEVDDTEVLFFAELTWNTENLHASIVRAISLYIDNNYDFADKLSYGEDLRFPLFDQYLWEWLDQKSFSSNGKYVIYYSKDIKGIIIGNPIGGKIHRIVSVPEEMADCNGYYYYNDVAEELLVITKANEIKRYALCCDSEEAIEKLNATYDDAYNKRRSLSPKHNPGDMTFINILYRAMGSCMCKPLGISVSGIADQQEVTNHISLTVKTPISGKVFIEKDRQELGCIECEKEEFEKTFDFNTEDSTFGIIFLAGSIEKNIYFNSSVNSENLKVDMENHFRFEEIMQCCSRAVARRKLQTHPTDIYAIYQLGWVGTEEDLNFLLSILEDHFMGSSLSYGNDGNRVWSVVRAVEQLSTKYRRNDAIPLLKTIAETARNEGMLKIAGLIDDCRIDLEAHRNYFSLKHRTDILIRTHLVVQVYINSKDNWIAEIDGSAGFEERIDWCYVRSNRERNTLIVKSVYSDLTFDIDIKNNNPYYRQMIDVNPPVFSRELSKEVLVARGDRILVIPEGIEVLADDFAFLFDERDKKYHFYEIDIPSSVRTIEPLFVTEDPGDAWASGKDFDCFDEITVAEGNESFCSVEGVLFTKDMKKLICYPCGKEARTYNIPDGVEVIGAFAFQCNQFLEKVNLPPTIRSIEWKAFSFCERLSDIFIPEGLETIDEDAFEFCNIKHLTLPRSLKKIHWMNLSSIGAGVLNLEIPDSDIEIDMSGYDGCYEDPYMPPLFLINGKNPVFEKYARRHKKNIVQGWFVDETGVFWSSDGSEIIEFPMCWTSDVYRIPENVTSIHRWAFNQSDVKRIIMRRELNTTGNTSGNDFSRIASKTDFRFEPDFIAIEESVNEDLRHTQTEMDLDTVCYGKSGKEYTIIELLGHGSDGSVYRIREDSRFVAIIYSEHKRTDAQYKTLLAMVENPLPISKLVEQQIEWPIDILFVNEVFSGYVMPWIYNEEAVGALTSSQPETDASLELDTNLTDAEQMILNELRTLKEMVASGNIIAEDTNKTVKSLANFVETDLQTWISKNRPRIDDEALIEQFAHRATHYINSHVQGSNQKVQEEENHLQNVFGNTWKRLLPSTQSSLISAGVLWNLYANISVAGFDYSGIIIAATSALESELKRVFYSDFQTYMLSMYGDPQKQSAETTYAVWPERLLTKTKAEYDNESGRGSASLPQLADNFTMGTLPYMFYDKNANQRSILQNRMREYLKTIVCVEYCSAPLKAFNNYTDENNFVKQCESIRTLYRNPAGHVDVLPRESAEECYTRVVGVGKVDAFRFAHEVQGLIMTLYGYLK